MSSSQKSQKRPPGTNGNGNGHTSPDDAFPLVLLCDDNEFDRIAINQMLQRHGFRVIAAETYDIALAALGSSWPFAAIIADYHLTRPNPKDDPGIMAATQSTPSPSGFELLLEAKQLKPDAARVLVTTDPIALNLEPLFGGKWFNKFDSAQGLARLLRQMLRRR